MEETSASERQALGSEPANQMLGTVETNSTDGLGEGSITQIVRRLNAETFTYFVGLNIVERDRIWVVGH